MPASSDRLQSDALPRAGVLRERLGKTKAEYLASAMDKDDSWVRKVRNGECGILIQDIPYFVHLLGLKIVDAGKVCIDPEIAKSYEVIVRRMTAERSLLMEDAE